MKHFKLLVLALTGFVLSANAQKITDKAVINTPTIQCDMCKGKIEKYLSRAEGVTAVKVNVKKKPHRFHGLQTVPILKILKPK